jgi:DNA-binding XRE family transcriptional regulator
MILCPSSTGRDTCLWCQVEDPSSWRAALPRSFHDNMVSENMLVIVCLLIACRCEGGTHLKLAPMDNVRKRFGDRIRALRNDRGWSQEELADRAGLHRTYIGSVERGEQNLSLVNIERLAATLGISLAELFTPFKDKTTPPP